MYQKSSSSFPDVDNNEFFQDVTLSPNNRWVIMAKLIPWVEYEAEYAQNFSAKMGAPAKPFRMALGTLIIKERLGTSDRETVEQIRENPYLQYFIGMSSYSNQAPFESSILVHFRKRIDINLINIVNKTMVMKMKEIIEEKGKEKKKEEEKIERQKNKGKLILDATCAPADIKYPTDLGLLNEARTQTEQNIDKLYEPVKEKLKTKPRTYRKIARKEYLKVAKKKKVSLKEKRKAIKKQLQYLKRNLGYIENLIELGSPLTILNKREYKILLVISELYRQQSWLYKNRKKSIENRIVSLSQPHIRPIVRGKAKISTEFGAKISASYFDGYVFLSYLSWNNFNESLDLKNQVEEYRSYTGYYPESLHVDKIYRTRENRAWCKDRNIRISGPPLGRPSKNISPETKKQAHLDEKYRNVIEGKFGQGKRRFSLDRIMSKLSNTAESSIAIAFLVMNLNTIVKKIFHLLFYLFLKNRLFLALLINQSYRKVLNQ